jgi:hypothetical protein
MVKTCGSLESEDTLLFRILREQEQEILKHKWFESERAGRDVGYAFARIDWSLKHRQRWMIRRRGGGRG